MREGAYPYGPQAVSRSLSVDLDIVSGKRGTMLESKDPTARTIRLVLGTLALATTACGGAQVAKPDDFGEKTQRLETVGRDGDASEGEDAAFDLGPYSVRGVDRGLTFKGGFDDLDGFRPAPQRGYRFELRSRRKGSTTLQGKCSERAAKTIEDLDGSRKVIEEEAALACICEEPGTALTRFYVEDLGGQYGGPIAVAGVSGRVVGAYELDDGDRLVGRPAGFRIEDQEGTVAAGGILPGDTRVWIRQRLAEEDKQRLVCALAGLMLWVPPAWPEPAED